MARPGPSRLPDCGVRLHRLTVVHPDAQALRDSLVPHLTDTRLVIEPGPAKAMLATFDTSHGLRQLQG